MKFLIQEIIDFYKKFDTRALQQMSRSFGQMHLFHSQYGDHRQIYVDKVKFDERLAKHSIFDQFFKFTDDQKMDMLHVEIIQNIEHTVTKLCWESGIKDFAVFYDLGGIFTHRHMDTMTDSIEIQNINTYVAFLTEEDYNLFKLIKPDNLNPKYGGESYGLSKLERDQARSREFARNNYLWKSDGIDPSRDFFG